MHLNRRRFLMLLGAAGGFSLSACVHNLTTSTSEQTTGPLAAEAIAPSPSASATERSNRLKQNGIADPPRGDVRIVVISDLNSQYGSTDYEPEVDKAIDLIPGWNPDLVLCGGDMVAGQKPSLTEAQIRAMWAAFDQHIGAPLRQANIPYGFTLGNHDASAARSSSGGFLFGKERNLAAAHWNNPAHDPGLQFVDRAQFPFNYTFKQNDMFFLVWDASTSQMPAEQIAWVDRSLASSEAQNAKLRLVIGHLPLYAVAVGRDDPGEYLENADALRSLLERHRVHTYISGHDHAYYPAHIGNLQALNSGILGSGVRPLLGSSLRPEKTLTVIDVNLTAADTVYTTYNATTMQVVDQQKLPRFIASPNGKLLRRDLEWDDLTPEEQAAKYTGSSY